MEDIPKVRFEALAGYCRQPATLVYAKEVRWLQAHDEEVLIAVIRDRTDDDFSAVLLARDLKERYLWVDMTAFVRGPNEAVAAADEKVRAIVADLDKARAQGDEKGKPVDFFSPVVDTAKLHPGFVSLSTLEGYTPAMELIKPMMRWYEDADGNFVEQFQTTGFDARIWELYLFAMLVEAGYVLDRSAAIPDFSARGLLGELCVEATTVNPTRDRSGAIVPPPPLDTAEQLRSYQRQYMPIKFAGPLTAKLAKKYWERKNVQGRPLVFAIQDFHTPMSMAVTRAALPIYLYGYDHDWEHKNGSSLVITPRKVDVHRWGPKEVPSGFFNLLGAENVSAVIANASATISKFDRVGVIAGFGSKQVRLIRHGAAADPDPNAAAPRPFVVEVNAADYRESWIEGLDVYHNPRASYPLDVAMLPGAAHHILQEDGQICSMLPQWQPMSCVTHIMVPQD